MKEDYDSYSKRSTFSYVGTCYICSSPEIKEVGSEYEVTYNQPVPLYTFTYENGDKVSMCASCAKSNYGIEVDLTLDLNVRSAIGEAWIDYMRSVKAPKLEN